MSGARPLFATVLLSLGFWSCKGQGDDPSTRPLPVPVPVPEKAQSEPAPTPAAAPAATRMVSGKPAAVSPQTPGAAPASATATAGTPASATGASAITSALKVDFEKVKACVDKCAGQFTTCMQAKTEAGTINLAQCQSGLDQCQAACK